MKRIAILGLIVLAGCQTPEQNKERVEGMVTAPYQSVAFGGEVEGEVRDYFTSVLRDPDSLQLRGISASKSTLKTGASSVAVCGFYNSRNGFGGYVGFKPFSMELVGGEVQSAIFDPYTANSYCYATNNGTEL